MHALALGVLRYSSPQISAAKAANTMSIPSYWGNKELSDYLKLDEEGVIAKALENPDFHDKPGRRRKKNTVESMGNKLPWPTTTTVATVVKMGLERFWNSIDKEVEEKSLPLSMIEKIGLKKEAVHQWVKGIWKDILEARAPWLPHDAYLKLLFLFGEQSGGDQRAFGGYDIILFDEAQDANPCMATIVMRQQAKKLGIIVVGDPYQRIYGFRGAGNEAFDDIKFKPVKTIYLTWSFRFGDEVADLANIMLRALGELVPVNGARKIDKVRAAVSMEEDFGVGNFAYEENTPPEHPGEPFTVIFRKNITLIEYAISFALEHPNHKLYLRIQRNFQKTTLFNTLREAFSLYHDNIRASTYPLKSWKSWEDLKLHVEAEAEDGGVPDSPILTMVVQLEPRLKDPLFREHLRRIEANVLDDTSRHLADVVLITAHQAKGLEWDRVQVAPDFKPDYSLRNRVSRTKYLKEEACVLYVALTRARKELIVSGPLRGWIAGDRGWERTFLQLMVPGEQGGVGCYFCAIQLDGPGSYPHPHGDEYGYLKCLERVLLRVEETVGCASFSGRMHREFALEQSAVPEEKAAVSTVMCLRCANAVVLARPPELQDLAGVDRILEVLGMYGKGVESVEVGWAERKAWDEAGAAKLETEMVEGWVEGGCWRTWREVREEMA